MEAHGPLSFSLVIKGQAPKHFTLQNTSSRVTIGRRLSSDFVLTCREVSFDHAVLHLGNKNRDTTLCIKDVSKNLTAFRHFKGANSSWCELRRDEFEVLHHRSQIRVPARLKRPDAGSVEQGDRRCEITVLLALPDAYCEWQRTGRWLYGQVLTSCLLPMEVHAPEPGHLSSASRTLSNCMSSGIIRFIDAG